MPTFLLRAASLLLTLVAAKLLSPPCFVLVLSVIGLVHYALAFGYSVPAFKRLTEDRIVLLRFLLLCGAVAASTAYQWPAIALLFGVHHVLSEAHTPSAIHPKLEPATPRPWLAGVRYLFHSLCYLSAARTSFRHELLTPFNLAWAIALSALWYTYRIVEDLPSGRARNDLLASEALFLALGLGSAFAPAGFTFVLLYHFVFWALLPFSRTDRAGRRRIPRYLALTVLLSALVSSVLISLGNEGSRLGFQYLSLIGFVHIGVSFAVSRQNPAFIRRWFVR